jgi:hypothetical protein
MAQGIQSEPGPDKVLQTGAGFANTNSAISQPAQFNYICLLLYHTLVNPRECLSN